MVLAIAAFLLTGALAGWVLWPARVSFTVDIDRMYDELAPSRKDPAVYLLRAGHGLRDVSRKNRKVIERRELVFSLALIALGTETLMWTLALALT